MKVPVNQEEKDGAGGWDLVISPDTTVVPLNFAEIWKYRDLLYLFTRRDIVSFYKQTILGPMWFFLQPLFTTVVYLIVFGEIAKLSTDGSPRVLFYLCGITFWNYFSECFIKTSTVFRDNSQLFGKVYFPRLLVPLSVVLSGLMRFFLQFALFVIALIFYCFDGSVSPNMAVLWLPVTIATMAVMGLGMGVLFSAITTKYRDMIFLLQFGVQLLMYATPVIYPASQIPDSLRVYLEWNPLLPLLEVTRYGFLGVGGYSVYGMLYAVSFSILLFFVSSIVFKRVERTFIDTV
jgi:lipopolysaccharide transport system permease protein